MNLSDRIKAHEGCRLRPYKDSEGILTVGYGRNLESVPFSESEVDLMFSHDLKRAKTGAESIYVYEHLNEVRQGVLIEMVFQMGVTGVGKFKKFLSAALQCQWDVARDEMLDSKWAKQTPARASRLASIFKRGTDND